MRDRFEGRETAPHLAHMPAHALGVPVVHRREGPDPALVGREHPHAVGAPHDVGRRGDNRPVVRFGVTLPAAVGREQPLRAHHAQHPRPGDPHPVEDPQPRVNLAMPLALERGAGQVAANGRQQLRIRQRGRRPAAPRASTPRWALQASPPRVERRARPFPHSTHPLETIAPPRRRGGRCAHRRDLRVAKGRRRSAARARSRNSSFSIDSSPMCRLAASSSAASGSPACAFRPSSRPTSARVFHASRR